MNSLDLYDFEITKPPTPVPPSDGGDNAASSSSSVSPPVPEPTLNEEVTQALGSLGRLWGGFRKQSQSAFELARKDFGQVVDQARSEITKITTEVTSPSTTNAADSTSRETTPTDVKGKGKERAIPEKSDDITDAHTASPPASPTAADGSLSTSIFSRLQAQLPPNLQPAALSSAITSASASVDLTQIRSTLATNIQRAQTNLNVVQAEKLAEGYLAKSSELFNQAGEFLKEAVKVVPPSGSDGLAVNDFVVSGTDVFYFPSPIGTTGWGGGGKEDDKVATPPRLSTSSRERGDTSLGSHLGRASTRAEALLRRLKYDPELLRLDPSKDSAISAAFASFEKEEIEGKGGVGGENLVGKISEVLAPGPEGELDADAKALIDTRDTLVPAELTNEVFWTRYFFRVQQVTQEEVRRKALLEDAIQREEEFSWEEEDDDETPADNNKSSTSVATTTAPTQTSSIATPTQTSLSAPQPTSPRVSEDSYDLVESKVGTRQQSPVAAPATPSTGIAPANADTKEKKIKTESDDGDDSDWE